MMENIIKEELKKNCVKDNLSGRFDKLSYRQHRGLSKHYIKSSLVGSYGYLYVTMGSAVNLNIYFNGLPVYGVDGGYSQIISLKFMSGDYIEIEGDADYLIVQIYGAEFEKDRADKILYNSNIYLEDCGGNYAEYLYHSFIDGKKNYSYLGEFNAEDVIEFNYNSDIKNARLVKDDKVYLCTNIDNYTTQYLCNFDYDKAILIPGFGEYLLGLVFLRLGKIYVSGLNNEFVFGEPVEIGLYENARGINAINSKEMLPIFLVEFSNGKSGVYYYKDSKFIEIYNLKSKKEEVCIIGNSMYVLCKDNYDQLIKKFDFNKLSGKVEPVFQKRIILADNLIVCDDYVMTTYNFMERFVRLEDL